MGLNRGVRMEPTGKGRRSGLHLHRLEVRQRARVPTTMQSTKGRQARRILVAVVVVLTIILPVLAIFQHQIRSLASFRMVNDHPLYVMHIYGDYGFDEFLERGIDGGAVTRPPEHELAEGWACSVFAALNKGGDLVLGRNFDWHNRPTLLLFTDPPDGLASVSLVDVSYLGLTTEKPTWSDRLKLRDAPYWPFDGMNEAGLAVGMMAVPSAQPSQDPQKVTIGSLHAIRLLLDRARTVDEAIALLQTYNIAFGGPPLHYLVADSTGQSAVVEFAEGEMVVLRNKDAWQAATNFTMSGLTEQAANSGCWRYATVTGALDQADGNTSPAEAMALLERVSQPNTMWSVVYGMTSGDISVAVGRYYDPIHRFQLPMRGR